jgi:hypothetical protein
MQTKMISFCGITCTKCDAYLATQAGDPVQLERVAAAWREDWGGNFTAETIQCRGCLSAEEPLCSNCEECDVRACAFSRGVTSCAFCDDYACATIEGFLSHAAGLRQTLDAMRAGHLAATGD